MKARLEKEIPGTRSKLRVSVQEKSQRIQPKSKWAKKTPKRTYEATKTKQKEKLKRLLWKKRSTKVVSGLGETVNEPQQQTIDRYREGYVILGTELCYTPQKHTSL